MRAIVTGISGQDGYFMANRLLDEGGEVLGLTSDMQKASLNFESLADKLLQLREFNYEKMREFDRVIEEFEPNLIFNFAAKATGLGMFERPYEISRINGTFVIDILEAIRQSPRCKEIVFCQASSSEMYGTVTETPQDETTAFRPKSPYGAAKLYAHNMISIYRTTYGVKCCSAILYNHESVRRSVQFVTKKIANAAARIKLGELDQVSLGSLDSKRDWGYAPEYVEAMLRMTRAQQPADYVIATGRLNTVRDLCEAAFGYLDLNYLDFVHTNADQMRATESVNLHGNPTRIYDELGWRAVKSVQAIMQEMVDFELKRLKNGSHQVGEKGIF